MTDEQQLHDLYVLCHRLQREAGSAALRAAAEAVLEHGVDAVFNLIEAAKGTEHEGVVREITWNAWNRR